MLGVRDECVMSRAFILNQKRRTFSVDVAKGEMRRSWHKQIFYTVLRVRATFGVHSFEML